MIPTSTRKMTIDGWRPREKVFIRNDNANCLLLKYDNAVIDLSSVSHALVVFSGVTISSVGRATWFDWTSGVTGRLTLKLGGVTNVPTGIHQAELILFDAGSPRSVVWGGTIPMIVR